jgi:hypothetical protein
MRKSRRAILGVAIAATVVLLVFALPSLARLWVDLRWYESLGHPDVLLTPLWTRLGLGAVVGLAVFAVVATSLKLAIRFSGGTMRPIRLGEPGRAVELDLGKAVARMAWPVAALVGLLAGLAGSGLWRRWLMASHGQAFGERDPLFGRDVGFYVFELPFLDALYTAAFWTLLVTLVLTAGMYAGRGGLGLAEGRPRADRAARVHLSLLGSLLFLVLAYGAWLSSAHLVLSQGGLVAGAGYTDVHARLPLLRAHLGVAILGAVLVAVSAFRRRLLLLWAALGLYAAVGILGRGLYPGIIQKYVVEPNELERERPYIEREIEATRSAFGLAGAAERELSGELALTRENVEDHHETIDNIRLWDHRPLLDTFGQIQEIRTYYEFASVDNDRYRIDGELRQIMLSPRELSAESLPNRTWINEHFTFTHGYGLTLGPVNRADDEGLPVLFVQDIPPESSIDDLGVTRPEIYFGELSNDYVFVDTETREFSHPSGEGNVYETYEGDAGIRVGGTLSRAALAVELGVFKVLLSDDLRDDSRVLLHRRVRDRVRRLAPFLELDGDPYMVVRDDGTLAWMVDAYTTTDRFPYARRDEGRRVNYMRNSVKAVIDTFDGDVTLYAADPEDPILATWRAVFPSLFAPYDEMPEDLRRHARYPLDIFDVQARMMTTYHMDGAELLYNREDQWQVPSLQRGRSTEPMEPYYTVMRLPGEDEPEFILMLPFTPARKDNLAAWMVARSDGEHLGELVVYEFPNDRLVYGPQQVLNRINQDADISQQLSLWDQRGSQADFGTLLVIPIEESLIYVLPLYLRSSGGRIPQLKRVIVVHENRIAMRETLDQAIAEIFEAAPPEPEAEAAEGEPEPEAAPAEAAEAAEAAAEAPADAADPRVRALRHFRRAVELQRQGDWAGYGEQLEALEEALRDLQPRTPPQTPPRTPPQTPPQTPAPDAAPAPDEAAP